MPSLFRIGIALIALLHAAGSAAATNTDATMLTGYATRIAGETIVYHSPDPDVNGALLVRSIDSALGIEWETAAVPDVFDAEAIDVVWMFAIQVDPAQHRFTLAVDGKPWLTFRNPVTNAVRDWTIEGPDGSSLRFRATMVDRFNDLMGYAILRLPRSALTPGRPVRLSVSGESAGSRAWYITFQAPISESASLTLLPAVVRAEPRPYQPVILAITHVGEPIDIRIDSSFGESRTARLELGGNRFELRHEAVAEPTPIDVTVTLPGLEPQRLHAELPPVRHWSIDLVQHTHTDIGYTRPQTEILPEQVRFIETALDLCDATDSYPDDARFRWTCETSWAVREFLRTRSRSQIDRLRTRAAEGRIEVTGMFLNMSEIVDEAGFGAFLEPVALARGAGIPVTTAVQNDVNGIAWCLADAFAGAGIDYLVMGQHAHRARVPFDRPTPFWWESPAGNRVLAFRADHYHTGNFWGVHTGNVEAVRDELLRYLVRLDGSGYPFDRIAVEHSGYPTDNAPPSLAASEVVRQWNELYVWPRLRCSIAREFPASLKAAHAKELPVVRQAWTDWWTDGFGSAARETAMARITQGRLAGTESILAMESLAGDRPPATLMADLGRVRENLLFWGEHTLGSAESIREPLCENSVIQWAEKAAFAWEAVKGEAALAEAALGRFEVPRGRGTDTRLLVVNTLNHGRSGILELYADHEVLPIDRPFRIENGSGVVLPVQRLRSRAEGSYWAIWVPSAPSFGWTTLRVVVDPSGQMPEHVAAARTDRMENDVYSLRFDAERGAIASLVDRRSGAELVDSSAEWGFGQLVHESLGNREQLEGYRLESFDRVGIRNVILDGVEDGPIWSSLRFHGDLPGCRPGGGVRGEIRLFHVEPRVEVCFAIDKERVFEPEGLYVAFPIAAPGGGGTIAYETLGGIVDPTRDIIPGASTDWQAMQTFVAARGDTGQVVLASNEIPLIQCGAINLGRFARQLTIDHSHLYSWVMNNYWTTNFCASQEGEFRFRYALASSPDTSDGWATRFGWSERVPLRGRLLAGCDSATPLTSRTLLACDVPNLILVAARPARTGGLLLQFRETDGTPAALDATSWQFAGAQEEVWRSNALEERLSRVSASESGRIAVAPRETVWLLFGRR